MNLNETFNVANEEHLFAPLCSPQFPHHISCLRFSRLEPHLFMPPQALNNSIPLTRPLVMMPHNFVVRSEVIFLLTVKEWFAHENITTWRKLLLPKPNRTDSVI